MWLIISLIIVGILLLVAELVLLPGLSVAGICSFLSFGVAIYMAFKMGTATGFIIIGVIIALSIAATIISLKAKTWQRFSLKNQVDGTSQRLPQEQNIKIGDRATTVTRLAPMGKIVVGSQTFEAKSIDSYIDPHCEVEVLGFENFSVIVKLIN